MKNKLFALIFRTGAFIFAVCGVLSQTGVFSGSFHAGAFMYYTLQSNLLVIVLFAVLIIRTAMSLREGTRGFSGWYARFGMVCAVNIFVTFTVFWTLLSSQVSSEYIWTFENLAVHAITPLLCLADYLFFTKGGHLKYRDVFYTAVFPLFYVLFSAAAGLAGYVYHYTGFLETPSGSSFTMIPVRAPYFFLDYWNTGALTIAYIAGIMIYIFLLAHCLYFLDRKRKRAELRQRAR